jgi:hypothetical protein
MKGYSPEKALLLGFLLGCATKLPRVEVDPAGFMDGYFATVFRPSGVTLKVTVEQVDK